MTNVLLESKMEREVRHTDITADAVKPVRTVRFAVMNLECRQ